MSFYLRQMIDRPIREPEDLVGRECGCPAYVIRCAHVDGNLRVVWLYDIDLWQDCGHVSDIARWLVSFGDHFRACGVHGTHRILVTSDLRILADRAEAEAAFARYEAILLGREVE